ncbi:hypothetical protein [uncultured Winogradskyella sp.]|uniref:hypothetical protein n=1 Tax=uncultured Winogradskyella sp. TaxID=395353 RepID=UPI00262D5C4E|nr:hypothetical protein [uncultured Winogradskyella sp.]
MTLSKKTFVVLLLFANMHHCLYAQKTPKILTANSIEDSSYLPDFSFAGYHNSEVEIPMSVGRIINATDYGVVANDGLDDSKALKKAIQEVSKLEGKITLQLPQGRIILSDILYLERDNFVLRGTGTGEKGTEIYCPRPLMYADDPEVLQELREYLIEFDKRQREKDNNIDLPFSQYAWSGGFIWTKAPNTRVKPYLQKYEQPYNVLANVVSGKRGEFTVEALNIKDLNVGDVVELQLFNKDGEKGSIISELYKNEAVKIGSHHWNFPDLPLVKQQVEIIKIKGNKITINAPLTIDIKPNYKAQLVEWKHLKEVGIEHFKITFPKAPRVAHHVEQGFNAIYLTRVFNSWVNNVVIENADSGVITEEIANVTVKDVVTKGENFAHYTVMMQGTYNVLAQGIKVYNKAEHPLSFNTLATKSVYLDCEVFVDPILDQHSGANHQNLFDNIKVHLSPNDDYSYPLFAGGGAGYWKPSHGAFSTFWNIEVNLLDRLNSEKPIILNGMKDGPFARVVGVSGNHKFEVSYEPKTHIEFINQSIEEIPSLYRYQLKQRLKK